MRVGMAFMALAKKLKSDPDFVAFSSTDKIELKPKHDRR